MKIYPIGSNNYFADDIEDATSSKQYFWISSEGDLRLASKIFAAKPSSIDLVIPPVVDGIRVRLIREAGFYACKALRTVYIHDGVELIGEVAFAHCKYLNAIRIPSTMKEIRHNTFAVCESLTNIIIDKPSGSISGSPWNCPNANAIQWLR